MTDNYIRFTMHVPIFLIVSSVMGSCQFEEVVAPAAGSLEIRMAPDDLGAEWSLEGPDGFAESVTASVTLTALPADHFSVHSGEMVDWLVPSPNPAHLTLGDAKSASLVGVYVPATGESGPILLNLDPDSARASWTISRPDGFSASGVGDQTLSGASIGKYTVNWGEVTGYDTPVGQTLTLVGGQSIEFAATYDQTQTSPTIPAIPSPGDWTDRGEIFAAGAPGEWDLYLWGGFGGSVVKRDGSYFLYYQGSDGYDDVESTVTHRSIGVATSSDGIQFTKFAQNPVLSWLPTNGIEEGIASGGAWLTPAGDISMYAGANTAISASQVIADARIFNSTDGFQFADGGIVLDHSDSRVWGSGDELFPVLGFQEGGSWYSFYLPNGTPQGRTLGVAWGNASTRLNNSSGVQASGAPVPAWGPAGWARLSSSSYGIFVSNDADAHAGSAHMDAYLMDPANPSNFVGPVQSYAFANASKGTVFLDLETETWFFYYRNADASAYGVRTAPVRWE